LEGLAGSFSKQQPLIGKGRTWLMGSSVNPDSIKIRRAELARPDDSSQLE
jgi:hypothetical protein